MKPVRRIRIHRVPVDIIDPQDLSGVLANLLKAKKGSQIVFVRSWDLVRANWSPARLKILNNAALILPVSRMIATMARFLRYPVPQCYYPFDTIIRILNWLENSGGSLFLLGGRANELIAIEQNLRITFPKMRFLGRYQGFFAKGMEGAIAKAISKASPSLLLSGIGIREPWLHYKKALLNKGLMLWSYEWFDFVLRKQRRPVKTAISRGHEWIFEFYQNPFRVFRVPIIWIFWLRLLLLRLFR